MKIKYSALVMGVSGKLNGSVGATNKGGAYLRNKGVVSNPQTVAQQAVRSAFGALSSQFRELTSAQITAWNAAAADFPVIDRLGDTRYLTGLGLFVQLNTNLQSIGEAIILNPPAKQAFPAFDSMAVVMEVTAGSLSSLNVGTAFGGSVAGFSMLVRMSPSVSPSITNVKNRLRKIGSASAVSGSTITFETPAAYTSVFGVPIVGQVVFAEVVLISSVSGEASVIYKASGVVASGD